jgi:sulfhydrogenase subunit beta (sulfur reductase)
MKVLKLKKTNLNSYLESLRVWGEIYGPVRQGEKYIYGLLDDLDKLDTKMLRTIIPAKKFLVPPKFNTFSFDDYNYKAELQNISNRIVFGVHPCEIHGILILDKFFLERFPDPFYQERRRKTAILGLSCVPDDKCFAKSTGTHFVESGFDLAFNELKDFYFVWVGSSLGDDLVRLRLDLFDEDIKERDLKEFMRWRSWRDSQYKLKLDMTAMPDIMELNYERPLWKDFGDKCLSCGACSMVCPTCPCYNMRDQLKPVGKSGERQRSWDSCMFKPFAIVAGGHNFRENRAERVKLWYTHKLKAFITEFGKPACVGCGRCIDTCPVDINVKTVATALKGVK